MRGNDKSDSIIRNPRRTRKTGKARKRGDIQIKRKRKRTKQLKITNLDIRKNQKSPRRASHDRKYMKRNIRKLIGIWKAASPNNNRCQGKGSAIELRLFKNVPKILTFAFLISMLSQI